MVQTSYAPSPLNTPLVIRPLRFIHVSHKDVYSESVFKLIKCINVRVFDYSIFEVGALEVYLTVYYN